MSEHEKHGDQEGLVLCRCIVRIRNGTCCKEHC